MNTAVLLLVLIVGDDLPPSNEPLPPTPRPKPVDVYDDYGKAYHEAVHLNRPLLVWVGQRPRKSGDNVDCYQPTFPDCTGPCVVVSRPEPSVGLQWLETLPGTPSREEIESVLSGSSSDRGKSVKGRAPPTGEVDGSIPSFRANPLRASSLESRVTPGQSLFPVRYARSC